MQCRFDIPGLLRIGNCTTIRRVSCHDRGRESCRCQRSLVRRQRSQVYTNDFKLVIVSVVVIVIISIHLQRGSKSCKCTEVHNDRRLSTASTLNHRLLTAPSWWNSKPNARIFQGQFSIAQLSLSFATEDTSSTGAPEDFLQLVSEELQVEAAVHPKDISAVVRLHTISLIDLRAIRPEHRYLITTKDESNENGDLLWASFRSVAQDHPEYAQLDQRVDFTVSHARIIVNREPIVELVHLLDTGVSADDELYVYRTTLLVE